jgi:hypothetical protein
VEFALFVSILLLLLAAVLDMGTLLNAHLGVTYAARQAALSASLAGTDPLADCDALAAIAVGLAGQTNITVTRIMVYEAGSDGLPLGGAGSTADADVYAGNPGCPNAASPPTPSPANWPPASRNVTFYQANMLGIEIDYTYTWQSAAIAVGALNVVDRVVVPLTPG